MNRAFGIINFAGNHIKVDGLQDFRPVGAFSFLGRYRIIDFPISNMSNSGIDNIEVFIRRKPRSLTEHLGTGRHYNINSKRGSLNIMYTEHGQIGDIYSTDITAYMENIECLEEMPHEYVVIAPSYMVYKADYSEFLDAHIESGADISMMYHSVDNAKDAFLNCNALNINKQKGVLAIEPNHGNAKNRNISMDTYVMSKELLLKLIHSSKSMSSAIINDFNAYYQANMSLVDLNNAGSLFDKDWPIYTHTNDSCPTQYFEGSKVTSSVVSNGCLIEGTVENSIIGRGCVIKSGAIVKNCIISADVVIGKGVHAENLVVDKHARLIRGKRIIAAPEKPGYVKRGDKL